jgi:type IV pilus assembly protein PilC
MKLDEFAFVNHQLAGMLKSGIPLEGALRELCATMKRGKVRDELQQLEADLAGGTPLNEALSKRQLPEFYVRILQVGVQSGNLTGALTLCADYYQKVHALASRLKALMVYPAIVLVVAFGLSILLMLVFGSLAGHFYASPGPGEFLVGPSLSGKVPFLVGLAMPVIVLGTLTGAFIVTLLVPRVRRMAGWRLPGFREARLSQFASSLAMLLKSGCSVNDSVGLLRHLESQTPLGSELTRWESRLAEGRGSFSELSAGSRVVPPLFFWIVAGEREDWATGFRRAAEVYRARAMHRIDMLLNAALPVSILFLAIVILSQFLSLVGLLRGLLEFGSGFDGF